MPKRLSKINQFDKQRADMVTRQIAGRGVTNRAVLRAMGSVPREAFVMDAYKAFAYDDTPLPLPGKQTISQPYMVAVMLSALRVHSDHRILEIGTGSGYAAALLGRMAREVHTVERLPQLVKYARLRLSQLNLNNVHVHQGDGTLGWPPDAPYNGIVVAAGGPAAPPALKEQLEIGGRLIIPIGDAERRQSLYCYIRQSVDKYEERDLGAVAFVPLIGEKGW